jgi:hypothetical protein
MTGNKYFTTPNPALATVEADKKALESAQTIAETKVKGATKVRDAARLVVLDDLHHLKAYVQLIADADPENAQAIIVSAGMSVKKISAHAKQDFVAKQGKVSASASLRAKAAARRASYQWQVSTDQKIWNDLSVTLIAHTEVLGLTPGVTHYFRHRVVTKTGTSDWSQVVSLLVK